jgi:hypothetical protein
VPELNFTELRERLGQDVRQPSFADIRSRQRRRTTRLTVTGAVLALVVIVAGTVTGTRLRSTPAPPIAPSGSPAPVPAQTTTSGLTTAPSGTLFAERLICTATACTTRILRSGDLGATWSTAGELPQPSTPGILVAASDTQLWVIDSATVNRSVDGGRGWQSWAVGGNSDGSPGIAGVAGGTVWIAQNGAVAVASNGGKPTATPAQPSGGGVIGGLAVLGPDRAAVRTGGDTATWYLTSDRGAHWAPLADPCQGTGYPHSPYSTLAGAPDGSLWAVCAGQPSRSPGEQNKQLVTSADGGRTWQPHGELESAGYNAQVVPFSATVAWRTGTRANLYHTTDAAHWTSTASISGATAGPADDGALPFTAVDADTGVYATADAVYATRDGGRTWQQHRLPPG